MCLPLTWRPCVSRLNLWILTKREQLEPAASALLCDSHWLPSCVGQWAEPSRAETGEASCFVFVLVSACLWQVNNKMCCLIPDCLAFFLHPSCNPPFSCCIIGAAFHLSFLTLSSSVPRSLSPTMCSNWQNCNLVAAVLYCSFLIGVRGCWQSLAMLDWLIDEPLWLPGFCLTNRFIAFETKN